MLVNILGIFANIRKYSFLFSVDGPGEDSFLKEDITFPTSVGLIRILPISGNVCWKMSPHSMFSICKPDASFPVSGISVSFSLQTFGKLRYSKSSSSSNSPDSAFFRSGILKMEIRHGIYSIIIMVQPCKKLPEKKTANMTNFYK